MPPRTSRLSRSQPKRKGRKASEYARIYHSRARVAWVKSLPCVVTGQYGDIDNAHVKNGGMGRKADYVWIVPMKHCEHVLLHYAGIRSFEAKYDIDLELAAIATEQAWQAYQGRNPEHISSIVKRVLGSLVEESGDDA